MTGDTGWDGTGGSGDDWPPEVLETAREGSVEELADEISRRLDAARGSKSPTQFEKIITLIRCATASRPPHDVADLVTRLGSAAPTDNLARAALDTAASRRSVADLSQITDSFTRLGSPADANNEHLLEAVILRRLPDDVAKLLVRLPDDARKILTVKLAGTPAVGDCQVAAVLWLRTNGHGDLAEKTAQQLAEQVGLEALVSLIQDLFAQQDVESANAAIGAAVNRELDQVATLAGSLHAAGDEHAGRVIDIALDVLEPESLLVLASLLAEGSWDEAADQVWKTVVPRVDEHQLIAALPRFPNPATILRTATRTHTISRVAGLAIEVQSHIDNGEAVVLETAAEVRTVSEIFDMAEVLANRGYGTMANALLDNAKARIHQRPGKDVGEFIKRLLDNGYGKTRSARRRRRTAKPILDNVAKQRDPEQLMSLIETLSLKGERGQRWYNELHGEAETAVADHYTGAELARLPLIRHGDHRPAVLEIEKKALAVPRDSITAPQFAEAIRALKDAGATPTELRSLLRHVGGRNLNYGQFYEQLTGNGMQDEADWILEGYRHPGHEARFFQRLP